jgi:hypothetical protein
MPGWLRGARDAGARDWSLQRPHNARGRGNEWPFNALGDGPDAAENSLFLLAPRTFTHDFAIAQQ